MDRRRFGSPTRSYGSSLHQTNTNRSYRPYESSKWGETSFVSGSQFSSGSNGTSNSSGLLSPGQASEQDSPGYSYESGFGTDYFTKYQNSHATAGKRRNRNNNPAWRSTEIPYSSIHSDLNYSFRTDDADNYGGLNGSTIYLNNSRSLNAPRKPWSFIGRSKSKLGSSFRASDKDDDIEALMGLVLQLQDEGKLDEVSPVLEKIKRLQEEAERRFDEELVKAGRSPVDREDFEQKEEESYVKPTDQVNERKKTKDVTFAKDVQIENEVVSVEVPDETPQQENPKSSSKIINLVPSLIRSKEKKAREAPEEPKPAQQNTEEESIQAKVAARKEALRKKREKEKKEKKNAPQEELAQVAQEPEKEPQIHNLKPEPASKNPVDRKKKDQESAASKERKKQLKKQADIGVDVLLLEGIPEEQKALRGFNDQIKSKSMKRAAVNVRNAIRMKKAMEQSRSAFSSGVDAHVEGYESAETSNFNQHSSFTSNVSSLEQPKRRMVTRVGYMKKAPPHGKRFARWRTRYFVLSGRLLIYSKSKNSKKSEGVIDLAGAKVEAVVVPSGLRNRGKNIYEVRIAPKDQKRVYRLRPDGGKSKKEAKGWAKAIKNNIIIADDEGDILRRDRRKIQKRRELEEKKAELKKQSFRSRSFRRNRSKDRLWESGRLFGEEEEAERRKNHFFQQNGAPKQIGFNVGAPQADEDINTQYKILKVTPAATSAMIKKAYRATARNLHPDKNPNTDRKLFANIARAYDILKDTETRARYDLCERVKQILRQGIIVRLHDKYDYPKLKILFTDSRFLNLYLQDVQFGTVLAEGYKTVEMRYVTHIYAGSDGFEGFFCPPGRADMCLTIHGARLGSRDIHLELESAEARDEFLDGIRILRCECSELFKQRLAEMKSNGMR